ncbi:MAG TPA: asparagine synthase-related protein [Candidatus Binataceae bacterium]|nr:asparagine synthase-related protein [Candidatus Binataceae bacterium]
MSGIAAIFNLDGAPADRALVEAMLAAAPYRGPDGSGIWNEGPIALGHLMMHATPESIGEPQPLVDAAGNLALVFAGRIDNREELIAAIDGAKLHTDAEIALGAYRCWGEEFAARILGDFTFALYDRVRQRLLCARDPLGVLPLYYFCDGRVFICASELHQLLIHPRVRLAPNEPMIAEVLVAWPQDPEETLYRGIFRLPGAFMLSVAAQGMTKRRYHDLDPRSTIRYRHDAEYAEHFGAIFRDAVRSRLRSSGGVLADLSGGLDSSSIVMVARDLMNSGHARVGWFDPVSMTFDHPLADEERYIAEVEAATGLRSYRIHHRLQTRDDCLATVRHYRDLPFVPNLAMFDIAATTQALQKSRVWLTGSGGDDFLSGSNRIYADLIRGFRVAELIRRLRAENARYALDPKGEKPLLTLYKGGVLTLVPPKLRRALKPYFKNVAAPPAVTADFARRTNLVERLARRAPAPEGTGFAQGDLYEMYASGERLSVLEMVDRFGARHGVEARHPFYDRRLVEFFFAIPEEQRRRDDLTKFVLRGAMKGVLPESIRTRRDKGDFGYIYPQTFRQMGGERLFDSLAIARNGWVDAAKVHADYVRMGSLYAAGSPEYMRRLVPLWAVTAVEMWFNEVFGQSSQGLAARPHRSEAVDPTSSASRTN